MRRALMVVREVASKDGQILFLGKSPKKVAKIMKKNNPYEKNYSKCCDSMFSTLFNRSD